MSDRSPRGYVVDHETPDEFVCRCTDCGVLKLHGTRAGAHSHADTHGLMCSPTGVTPVSCEAKRPQPGYMATVTYESIRSKNEIDVGGPILDVNAVDVDEMEGEACEIAVEDSKEDRVVFARYDPESGDGLDAYSINGEQDTFLGELVDIDVQPVATDGGHDLYACETPHCDGEKEVVTPDGYVCHDCADKLEDQYESEAKLLTDGGTERETKTFHRAICVSCGRDHGINRPHLHKVGANVDRKVHNSKVHQGDPVAEVESFESDAVGQVPAEMPPHPGEDMGVDE